MYMCTITVERKSHTHTHSLSLSLSLSFSPLFLSLLLRSLLSLLLHHMPINEECIKPQLAHFLLWVGEGRWSKEEVCKEKEGMKQKIPNLKCSVWWLIWHCSTYSKYIVNYVSMYMYVHVHVHTCIHVCDQLHAHVWYVHVHVTHTPVYNAQTYTQIKNNQGWWYWFPLCRDSLKFRWQLQWMYLLATMITRLGVSSRSDCGSRHSSTCSLLDTILLTAIINKHIIFLRLYSLLA